MNPLIYRPIKSPYITQRFGENLLPLYKELGMLGHNGIDIICWRGEPVYHSGLYIGVAKTETDQAGGIGVDIISQTPLVDNDYIKLRYWHLQKVNVYDGQIIHPGDLIGWGDSTGYSSGDHLHFGFKRCYADGKPINPSNGYFGAEDPLIYSDNFPTGFIFILDYLGMKQRLTMLQKLIEIYSKLISLLKSR